MKKVQKRSVPWSGGNGHPLEIAVQKNDKYGTWDMLIFMGNFKTKEDARAASDNISKYLELAFGATTQSVQ